MTTPRAQENAGAVLKTAQQCLMVPDQAQHSPSDVNEAAEDAEINWFEMLD